MTPIAALVAEAIAHADRTTTGPVFRAPRYHWISFGPGEPQLEFCRIDVRDAVAHYLATKAAEAEGRAERAEAALDAAEREASLRLDRINTLRLCAPRDILDLDDQQVTERVRKYGPTVATIDDGMRLAFQQPTPFDYGAGRSVRERVSAENPGARIRLWRLVCIEDWYRLPGEEAPRG